MATLRPEGRGRDAERSVWSGEASLKGHDRWLSQVGCAGGSGTGLRAHLQRLASIGRLLPLVVA